MTDYMAQQSLNLPPSSRQDIISALLNDYGTSFEGGDTSPYNLSPVPAFKELPPPPPSERAVAQKFSNDKIAPAVGLMSMRFQLRVDEPASLDASNGSSSSEGSPTRIVSKRIKRRSVPRSLTLTKSNGSTAELPEPTTASQSEAQTQSEQPATDAKLLPPPPPPKSARRQPSAMGNSSSKSQSPGKDSPPHPQDGKSDARDAVKRKLVPKFTSLAELGNGRRGGKGGPLPQPRGRKGSLDEKPTETQGEDGGETLVRNEITGQTSVETSITQNSKPTGQNAPMQAPRIANNPLPPTPKDEAVAATPPPKKPFGGMGLPSNPKHKKGKSNTGFDVFKAATWRQSQHAPAWSTAATNIMAPGPTQSLNNTETMQEKIVDREQNQPGADPASLALSNDQRRPFSFESVPPPPQETLEQQQRQQQQPTGTTTPPSTSPVSPVTPPATAAAARPISPPPRTTSRAPPAFASLPSQQRTEMSEDSDSRPTSPNDGPPFIPLTEAPIPLVAPSITAKHHACYSKHATFVWSKNTFQPMACMVCKKNDQERKWACVWCYLRLCVDCSKELSKTPGRDLQAMLDRQSAKATYAGDEYFGEEENAQQGAQQVLEQTVNGFDGKRMDFT